MSIPVPPGRGQAPAPSAQLNCSVVSAAAAGPQAFFSTPISLATDRVVAAEAIAAPASGQDEPSAAQLRSLFVCSAVPFVVFGFADNSLMLLFGEAIEVFAGSRLGISTMAAAALGNLFSDAMGIGIGKRVEALFERWGVLDVAITDAQRGHAKARRADRWSAVVGIAVGCILGMWPLLLFDEEAGPGKADKGKGGEAEEGGMSKGGKGEGAKTGG